MDSLIIRDHDLAQQWVLQGLLYQLTVPPTGATVKTILEWALEVVASGLPLPPTGFVADLGHTAFGFGRELKHREAPQLPGVNPGLLRTYEDQVMGKIYADWTFERASDAMRRYQGRDRHKGLAYVIRQMRERGNFMGVEMPPGIIRSMLDSIPDDLLRKAWDRINQEGPLELLIQMYDSIIQGTRRMAEVLAMEDIVALEQRTALAEMGQYIAHRQVLQTVLRMEESLPKHKLKPLIGRQEVPTRVLDEDTYPVGGFSSISTKGSIESLLHSQLAYMEKDKELQPDMFDIKFLRDELYFYSRDENQFLRRRRSFVFVLYPELIQARFKDAELPCQRIVMLLGLLVAVVHKLSEWLHTDALKFHIVFVEQEGAEPLKHEFNLFEMLLREPIENQTVSLLKLPASEVVNLCKNLARKSLCHCLAMSTRLIELAPADTLVVRLQLNAARPVLQYAFHEPETMDAEDAAECWNETLQRLLQLWI